MSDTPYRGTNAILSRLSPVDYRLLEPHLDSVKLPARRRLETPGKRIDHVFFIEEGIASALAHGADGRNVEVGLVGPEGMSGIPLILGADRSPNEIIMQVPGTAKCLRADNLKKRMGESRTLHQKLLCYVQAFLVQVSQTALANGRNTIDARVARWLVMAHDRNGGADVDLSHEMLADMLGVRRPGITVALKALTDKGFLQTDRRAIRVIDRRGLTKAASGAYGVAEAEYERLLPKA